MIRKFPFPYPPAEEDRMIHLYLPDEYEQAEHQKERYPVIYMFDGQNLFSDQEATFGKSWGLRDFLDKWFKKVIIVGMECSHRGHDRLKEYSPYRIRTSLAGTVDGTGVATMKWITTLLKPYIDQNFRTWSHREATAIAGSSMGGLMSLYAILHHNQVFSKAACVSPSVGLAMPQLKKEARIAQMDPDTRIFFSWGSQEKKGYDTSFSRNILNLEALCQQHGASTWLYHQIGGRHCEADWQEQVPTWMDFLWL